MRSLALVVTLLLAGCSAPPSPTPSPDASSDASDATTSITSSPTSAAPMATFTNSTVGDSWHWRGRFTFNLAQAPPAGEYDWNAHVASMEDFQTSGGPVASVRRDGTVTPTSGSGPTTTTTSWARQSDYALLKQTVVDGSTTTHTTWRQPCKEYQWPMKVGDAWTSSCVADISVMSGSSQTYTGVFHMDAAYKVEAFVSRAVDGKALKAHRLNVTVTGDVGESGRYTKTIDIAPAACGAEVSLVTRDLDRGAFGLVAFTCQAAP